VHLAANVSLVFKEEHDERDGGRTTARFSAAGGRPLIWVDGTRWFDDVSGPSQRHGDALPHASEYCDR